MAVAEKLLIEIEARTRDAEKRLKAVEGKMDNVGSSGNKLAKMFKTGLSIGVAVVAFKKLASAAGEAVEAFKQQEQAERRLAQAVENNPLLTGDSAERIQAFASELQSVTTVGDETAISLAAMAAASGRTETEIMGMVEAAADVSAAMGITMDSAMRSLNKSFGGLTGELGELVPELQNLTKEQLEAGGAVDLIRQKFDGAAEAIGDTGTGAIQQFRNAIGDLKEVLGGLIVNAIGPLIEKVTEVAGAIGTAIERWRDLRNVQRGTTEGMSLGDQIAAQRRLVSQAEEQLAIQQERVNNLKDQGHMAAQQLVLAQNALANARQRLDTEGRQLNHLVQQQKEQEAITDEIENQTGRQEVSAETVERYLEAREAVLGVLDSEKSEMEKIREQIDYLNANPWAPGSELETDRLEAVRILYERIAELQAELRGGGEGIVSGVPGLERSRDATLDLNAGSEGPGRPTASPAAGGGASAIAAAAGGAIAGAASSLVSGMLNVVTKFVDIFKQAIVGSEAVKEVMDNLKSGIADALAPAAKALADAIKPLVPTIVAFASGVGQLLIPIFQGIGNLLQTALMPILQAMLPAMAQLGQIIQSVFVPLWQRLGGLLAGQMIPVFEILGNIIQMLNPTLQIWGALMHMFSGVMQSLIPVLELVSWVFEKLADASRFLWNNALMPFGNKVLNLARNLAEGFDKVINGLIRGINDWLGTSINTINISSRVPNNLDRIEKDPGGGRSRDRIGENPKLDHPPAPAGGGGGGTGGMRQGRNITVNIDIFSEIIAGEGGIRDLAVMIRDEIRAAEALGA